MSSTYFISTRDEIIAATHAQSLQRARVRSRGLLEYLARRPRVLSGVGRGAHIELLGSKRANSSIQGSYKCF